MSDPSKWALSLDAARTVTPQFVVDEMLANTVSRDCYPLAMGYYPIAKGHSVKRLQHNDNILIYCTAGTGTVVTDRFRGLVKQGDLLLLPMGQRHEYWANDEDPWTIYWFHVKGESCNQLFANLGFDAERPVVTVGLKPQLLSDFQRLVAMKQSGFRVAVFMHCAAIIRQILCYLALELSGLQISSKNKFNLDEIQNFMQQRLQGDLALETLAAAFNCSKYHFSNKYKQLTGYPPIKHFIHMKMERACYLLDSESLPVKVISHQLGYEDPQYFSRLFHKTIGLSPTQYRLQGHG